MFEKGWEENLMEVIRKNIVSLLEKHYESNQTYMARELDIKPNTLYTYINTKTKPPISFIYKLCSKHNLSVDSFLSDELTFETDKLRKKDAVVQFYSKYKGEYYTYFQVIDSNSLKEGLIQEGYMEVNESGNITFEILNSGKQFNGIINAADELIYFDLKGSKEKINIVIKNPGKYIKEKYMGGIGITNISSPEDNRIPSAQKIILSRRRIPVEKYFKTLSEFLEINTCFKVKKKILKEMLTEDIKLSNSKYEALSSLLENNKISNEDKLVIGDKELSLLQQVLDKEEFTAFMKYVSQNKYSGSIVFFNSIKVNMAEDKMIYRFIKNEFTL